MLAPLIQSKQLLRQGQGIQATGGGQFLQLHAGRMQQLVGQASGQLLQYFFGRAAIGQRALRLGQLFVAQVFALLP